jgi:hypothetical protein
MLKQFVRKLAGSSLYSRHEPIGELSGRAGFPPDFDDGIVSVCRAVAPYTMTSVARIYALCKAAEYVVHNDIVGSIVECGVWKGGSVMAIAMTLTRLHKMDIDLYLFDTFDGMTPPNDVDRTLDGTLAQEWLDQHDRATDHVWAVASKKEVERNVLTTGYPRERLHFIEGPVEQTIPQSAPDRIALLRLDTDWYESTKHELQHLFPRLVVGGVIVIDDYGHWQGARLAVDEYVHEHRLKLLLNRIDYTGRVGVKIADSGDCQRRS